jgi:hypothetical protein
MGNLFFWLGVGAAQKGAGSKPIERRHWVASLIVGILGALLIAVGMFSCWSAIDEAYAKPSALDFPQKRCDHRPLPGFLGCEVGC